MRSILRALLHAIRYPHVDCVWEAIFGGVRWLLISFLFHVVGSPAVHLRQMQQPDGSFEARSSFLEGKSTWH